MDDDDGRAGEEEARRRRGTARPRRQEKKSTAAACFFCRLDAATGQVALAQKKKSTALVFLFQARRRHGTGRPRPEKEIDRRLCFFFRLDAEDEEEEAALLRTVWLMVRCGRVAEARQLCRQCGQPWRKKKSRRRLISFLGPAAVPAVRPAVARGDAGGRRAVAVRLRSWRVGWQPGPAAMAQCVRRHSAAGAAAARGAGVGARGGGLCVARVGRVAAARSPAGPRHFPDTSQTLPCRP